MYITLNFGHGPEGSLELRDGFIYNGDKVVGSYSEIRPDDPRYRFLTEEEMKERGWGWITS